MQSTSDEKILFEKGLKDIKKAVARQGLKVKTPEILGSPCTMSSLLDIKWFLKVGYS